MATGIDLALAARVTQMAIRARLLRDVTALWPVLDKTRVDATWPRWIAAMKQVVTRYHVVSAQSAGRYMQRARTLALDEPTPTSSIVLPHAPAPEWMDRSFGYTGPGLLNLDRTQPNTALTATLGTASRIALAGGRMTVLETVQADPRAVGWYRVTDGAPCGFCALLAARGAVYKTQLTGGFQAHNHCACFAAPAYSRDQELPAISQVAADVYAHRGDGPALPAFRKAWAEHLAQAT